MTRSGSPAGEDYLRKMRGRVRALDRRIADADDAARVALGGAARARARAFALEERRARVRWFAMAHLPPSAEGLGLVHRLDRFLAERGVDLGPEVLDALAAYLDPDRRR